MKGIKLFCVVCQEKDKEGEAILLETMAPTMEKTLEVFSTHVPPETLLRDVLQIRVIRVIIQEEIELGKLAIIELDEAIQLDLIPTGIKVH